MTLSPADMSAYASHEEELAELLQLADAKLQQHPELPLCSRQQILLQRLEDAFAGQSCPPGINLLTGGLAEDDWRAPHVVDFINDQDTTARNNWQAITPQLLRACEDALAYLEAPAFCYVLPAYLRQYLLRPGYMCTDSIFHYLGNADKVSILTPVQQSVVEDVFNEFRCREQERNGEVDDTLLPWEQTRLSDGCVPREFAEAQARNYATRYGV